MASLPHHPRPGRLAVPLTAARWVGLVTLLPAEVFALSLAFDAAELVRRGGWWGGLIGRSHHVIGIGVASAAASLIFGGRRFRDDLREAASSPRRSGRSAALFGLIGHLAALAAFVGLTAYVFSEGFLGAPHPGVEVVAWGLTGSAAVGLWALALVPAPAVLPLARRCGGALLVGAGAGVAAWAAGQLARSFWQPLGRSTLLVSYHLLALVCGDAFCRPDDLTLGTASFEAEIAPQCSGYEGIGLIWVFLAVYLWAFRRGLRFPRVFLLVPIATAVMWLSNSVRIAGLVFIGSRVSESLAAGGFHSQAGWLVFNAVGLGLVAVTRRSRFFAADGAPPARAGVRVASPYLAPLFVLLAGTMITGALTGGGFDRYYPLRVVPVAGALWYFRRDYLACQGPGSWSWSWAAFAIGVGVFAVWMALEPGQALGGASPALAEGLAGLPAAGAAAWLTARVLGSVIVVPVAEELAFRGFLGRRLIAADFLDVPPGRFTWPSFLISSALFGAMHSRWLAGTAAGMLYALAYSRRGRLGDAVLAHATTNALIAADVLLTSSWSLWT